MYTDPMSAAALAEALFYAVEMHPPVASIRKGTPTLSFYKRPFHMFHKLKPPQWCIADRSVR